MNQWKKLIIAALLPCLACAADKAQLWNFNNASIRSITQIVSNLTKKNIIIAPNVTGNITLTPQTPMTTEQLFSSYLSMLQQLNFAAVYVGDNTLKIVPATEVTQYAREPVESIEKTPNSINLRIIPVHNSSASSIVSTIRPFLSKSGHVSAYSATNSLIISGRKSNLDRIESLVKKMDSDDSYHVQVVKLKYASAKKIETILNSLQSHSGRHGKKAPFSVTADESGNTILVTGNAGQQQRISKLIHQLDQNQAHGQTNTAVIQLNYLDAKTFAPILAKTAQSTQKEKNKKKTTKNEVSVQAELDNNALIVHAPNELMTSLKAIIHKLDQRPQQVLIEAIIVNMNQSTTRNLGIDWSFNLNKGVSSATSSTLGIIHSGTFDNILTALNTDGNSNILATPSILVLNNKKADISSGENIALSTGNFSSSGSSDDDSSPYYQNGVYNNVERKDVTLSLEVTPHIAPNETIRMHIEHQDDSLPKETVDDLNQSYLTNKISTDVLVNSGDILVLGGLSQDSTSETLNKVPLLGDIPGVGKLFQHLEKEVKRKNLMIFIRPVIISDAEKGRRVTKKKYINARAKEMNMATNPNVDEESINTTLPSWRSQAEEISGEIQLPIPE